MTANRQRASKGANPFYVLLVLAGVAFVITCCAYGVLTVRQARNPADAPEGWLAWLDAHAVRVLTIELVVIGLATVLAIATDEFWAHRASQSDEVSLDSPAAGRGGAAESSQDA